MMILPAVDPSTFEPMMRLHERFPESTRIGIGLHPTELGADWERTLDDIERMLEENPGKFSAIGETGIDLYWDKSQREEQKISFGRQLDWAVKYDKPLIIHCREGLEDTLDVIASREERLPEMIFHSFTGSPADVRRIREVCDPWFGINGVVTFKNAKELREALPEIGIERIVLETDSPYLAPVPHRGKRNESAYLGSVCSMIASTLNISAKEVETLSDLHAKQIFKT